MSKRQDNNGRPLPDVAMDSHVEPQGALEWVGMDNIAWPLRIRDGDVVRDVPSRAQVYVNLTDPHARGIHMSRLYRALNELGQQEPLSPASLVVFLHALRDSHSDVSTNSFAEFDFTLMLRRHALVSDHTGWNSYPYRLQTSLKGDQASIELLLQVYYSSTCPASAALARQVIQHGFEDEFQARETVSVADVASWLSTTQGISATPHGQRSAANVRVRIPAARQDFPLTALVDLVEDTIETPVQTAVKREDEQEFAIRNGQNPMFCEDAARKLKVGLEQLTYLEDFQVVVEHFESLHAHNAVSVATKGIPGGFDGTLR